VEQEITALANRSKQLPVSYESQGRHSVGRAWEVLHGLGLSTAFAVVFERQATQAAIESEFVCRIL
jgi:hypothetical protein